MTSERAIFKRLDKEFAIIKEKNKNLDFSLRHVNDGYEISFIFSNFCIIIVIGNHYPFRGPHSIKINGVKLYDVMLQIDIEKFQKRFNQERKCLCCDSILCADKWHPAKTLNDVLEEVVKILHYRNVLDNEENFKKSFLLRAANGGRRGYGQSIPHDLCRYISTFIVDKEYIGSTIASNL